MPKSDNILTDKFLSKYQGKQPNWGFNGLGYAVYKRTYSRTKPDGKTEEWWETVARCLEGAQKIGAQYTKEEAERLYDHVFNLRCNFAGRMLWQLGTSTVDRFGANSLLNCFAAETEILTSEGIRPIGSLVGHTPEVMTEYGKWVPAEIKSFGEQRLYRIELTKGRSQKTVYATKDHRWFRRPYRNGAERSSNALVEVTTEQLVNGDNLASTYGQSVRGIGGPSLYGIAHGIVFGDGSVCNNVGQVRLCGDKDAQFLKYFPGLKTYDYEGDTIVGGLPKYFKDRPTLDMDKPYLYGWMAGYFAADGSITEEGQAKFSSASRENLEFVRDVCVKLGVGYSSISSQERVGIGQIEPSTIYSLNLNGVDLTEEFFLVAEHRKRFVEHVYRGRKLDWKVESVTKTDRIETVYCAVVPDTHSFVLEGNILTGNCYYISVNTPKAFLFIFENLMLGGGVGFSVRREDVHELPRVKSGVYVTNVNTKDADFIVPDSRGGWIKLLENVLGAYYTTGKSFSYSTILVRGAGEKISGFGGTASGPKILTEGIDKIATIMRAREEKKLRSIDVLDICNVIGSIVVAGNVRRSAQIALGDPDDHLFTRAKNWNMGNVPNWRAMSNNTIYADSFEYISPSIWDNGYDIDPQTKKAKGEPYGFFNLNLSQKFGRLKDGPMKDSKLYPADKDNCTGLNPCQPAWAPILTKDGLRQMKDVKEGTEIWSETGWTKVVKKWSTGVKKVFRYQTTGGVFFGTENHRVVCDHEKVEAGVAEGIDQLIGPYNSDVILDTQDVMDGIVFGDGSVHEASNNLLYLCVGQDDMDYLTSEVKKWMGDHRPGLSPYAWEVSTRIKASELPLTYMRSIPDRYMYGTPEKAAAFLRGLYTANGSIVADRVTLKASSFKVIQQVQIMLSSLGIRSYYTTNRPTMVTFSNGDYLCRESYDLNITKDRVKFAAIIGFIQRYKTDKLAAMIGAIKNSSRAPKLTYDIVSHDLISEEEVFDITVDNNPHTYWTGGVNVSNCAEITLASGETCNLSELYLNNIRSREELIDCAKLLYKTQKAVCAMPFLHEITSEVVHKNMRIGLGVTGVCQSFDKLDWLDECYIELRRFDKEWSKQRGWPCSIKLTTVKPSGSLSLLGGATPGIHPAYSQFYIRRVRMASEDSLVKLCREAGYHVEYVKNFDESEDRSTAVVEFPCETPKGALLAKDTNVIKQLEMVVKLQSIWADNAVSVTAYYDPAELNTLKGWLKDHYDDNIKSVSFLLRSAHGFIQAPYEEITEEAYRAKVAVIKPMKITESGDTISDLVNCEGGACPIR